MPKAALYLRVSTEEQETDNQKLALIKLAHDRGYEIGEIYQENETAWKRGHQAELSKCQQDAFQRKFDVLLVWSIDRLSRLGPSSMFKIVEGFWDMGIVVISREEAWLEQDTIARPLLIAVFASMAKWGSDRNSERTKAGLARRRAEKPIPKRGPDKKHRKHRSDYGVKHRKKVKEGIK